MSNAEQVHVNCVTSMLNADELVIEFRRVTLDHTEIAKRGGVSYTADDVRQAPILAHVAVTFSGAIALATQLAELIPSVHEFRVKQSAPWLTPETLEGILHPKEGEAV